MQCCSEVTASGGAPTPECLALAAQHIAHDLELFGVAWAERDSRLGWSLWFILARSLMDFFFRFDRKAGQDDILAIDFPASAPWKELAEELHETAQKLPHYAAVRAAANKNAAHLTYARTAAKSAGNVPPSEPVHRFLEGVAAQWLQRLEPGARVWFGR